MVLSQLGLILLDTTGGSEDEQVVTFGDDENTDFLDQIIEKVAEENLGDKPNEDKE